MVIATSLMESFFCVVFFEEGLVSDLELLQPINSVKHKTHRNEASSKDRFLCMVLRLTGRFKILNVEIIYAND